ncbi:hypothetical protein [Curtobacterium sp. MCBD17_003]|uniref:hypothetical protein n=1 Tax=Curtobacterium sp. MCBD17_003 TaxID=2175667 RepID=UPI000DA7942A|nr:hypothetical protein [Curtobacterium sp. MCBD17_003]WIE54234.1 hypothetical protein DEI88_014085 [Curtobacterium sp. MCBD17_003]
MTVRYIAQRATTRAFLDFDVPLLSISRPPTWELSAAGSFEATISPDLGRSTAEDGKPLFDEYGTILNIEEDGEIRWRGLVTEVSYKGSECTVSVSSMGTYPHGIPFLDAWQLAQIDPAEIVRRLWAHVQSFPDGDLGITVTGSTPLRIGSFSTMDLQTATDNYTSAKATYTSENAKLSTLRQSTTDARKQYSTLVTQRTAANAALTAAKKTKDKAKIAAAQASADQASAACDAQQNVIDQRQAAADAQETVVKQAKAASDAAYAAKKAAAATKKEDGGAYTLSWWESPDVGDEIRSLASDNNFDWTERHSWNATRDAISTEIVVSYPRVGRYRDDLRFVQGENITLPLEPDADGDDYANSVIGIGAGEGAASLRRTTAVRDGRLRRVTVLSAKDVKSSGTLDKRIAAELSAHRNVLQVDSITVRDHTNARIGSWQLGDDILVQATLPHVGDFKIRHRIVGWSQPSDTTAELKLERSDSFTYGG